MKRLFLAAIFILFATQAWAGGECLFVKAGPLSEGVYKVHIKCTADSGDASMSDELPIQAMSWMTGRYFYQLVSYPGGTAPTDASDLEVTDSGTMSYIGGNGTNFIDATSRLRTLPYNTFKSLNDYPLIDGDFPLTFTITNNSVNSAEINFLIYLLDN